MPRISRNTCSKIIKKDKEKNYCSVLVEEIVNTDNKEMQVRNAANKKVINEHALHLLLDIDVPNKIDASNMIIDAIDYKMQCFRDSSIEDNARK